MHFPFVIYEPELLREVWKVLTPIEREQMLRQHARDRADCEVELMKVRAMRRGEERRRAEAAKRGEPAYLSAGLSIASA